MLSTFLVSVPQPSYQHIIGPKSPDLADESSFKSSLLDPNSTSRKDMYHSLEPLHTPQDPFFVFNNDGLLRELPSQIMHWFLSDALHTTGLQWNWMTCHWRSCSHLGCIPHLKHHLLCLCPGTTKTDESRPSLYDRLRLPSHHQVWSNAPISS